MDGFQAGIFFDNEQTNVARVAECGANITSILVPSSHDYKINIQSPIYAQYKTILSALGQDAAEIVDLITLASGQQTVNLDVISGINQDYINYLVQWVMLQKQQGNTRLVAIFDWDRTLSVVEGLYGFGSNGINGMVQYLQQALAQTPNNYLQDALQKFFIGGTLFGFVDYYCGGPHRVAMLQSMFNFLYEQDVRIIVLTNNPTCITNRLLFEEMMSILTGGRPVGFLCSYATGGNKKQSLQQPDLYQYFSTICPAGMGGKRSMKKTRKQHKKRRGGKV